MSAFLQHLNVTALFESHATVVHSSWSNDGTLSDAGEGGYLRDAHRSNIYMRLRNAAQCHDGFGQERNYNCLLPKRGCEGRHIVRGQVLEVFIVQGGQSFPYDWKHTTG